MVTTLFIDFSDAQWASNSVVGDGILPKFKLVQALINVLVTCKNKEDPSKNEGIRVVTTFLPLQVYGDFSRRSRAANSAVRCLIFDLAEFRTHPIFYGYPRYLLCPGHTFTDNLACSTTD